MKNLHKKIGVVALSGLVLVGSGLAANSSIVHANGISKSKRNSRYELENAKYILENLKSNEKSYFYKVVGHSLDGSLYKYVGGEGFEDLEQRKFNDISDFYYFILGEQPEEGLYMGSIENLGFVIEVGHSGGFYKK